MIRPASADSEEVDRRSSAAEALLIIRPVSPASAVMSPDGYREQSKCEQTNLI